MLADWRDSRPRGARGGRTVAGMALFVPDGGRAGQADELAPGGEPLVPSREVVPFVNP